MFGPAHLQKVVGDFFLYQFGRLLQGILLKDVSELSPTEVRGKPQQLFIIKAGGYSCPNPPTPNEYIRTRTGRNGEGT